MRRFRILVILFAAAMATAMFTVSIALAGNASQGSDADPGIGEAEARAEQVKAVHLVPAANPQPRGGGGGFEVFAGLDDATVPAFRIDPGTNISMQVFSGVEVWGAAYDYDNDQVYVSEGIDLYVWPVGSPSPTFLATVSDTTSATVVMEGLAYYDGTLYASKVSDTGEGEGIFEVNLTTFQATRVITYADASQTTISGIDIDPATGTLYGVNDDSDLRGLVQIDPDGTVTVITAYMAGETDVDGLAVGEGRAYLITDDQTPPWFEVWDFATASYVTPISTPFTTTEVFAGGAYIAPPGASIDFTKTVGTNANVCAPTDSAMVGAGADVTYCYYMTNTGAVTLTLHDVEDSELGTILGPLFPAAIGPGGSAYFTITTPITASVVNTATWTAHWGQGQMVSDTDTAEVMVVPPGLVLTKTVGTDANVCAVTDSVAVSPGTQVTYCYEVENTGTLNLTMHDLVDSELGTILSSFPYTLTPGATVYLTQSAVITTSVVNTATWTAYPGSAQPVTATDTAEVTVAPLSIVLSKTVGTDANVCAATDSVTVPSGTQVTYCYEVENTGISDVTIHDLEDSELGTILAGFPYTLTPGATVYVTESAVITASVVNTATWTAGDGVSEAMDTDTAEVMVPEASIDLTKTVSLDGSCGTEANIIVGSEAVPVDVTYCYTVQNTGDITFTTHDLVDDQLGAIMMGFAFDLGPGASLEFTQTATITESTTNVATWSAHVEGGPTEEDVATANVNVEDRPTDVSLTQIGGPSPQSQATWLLMLMVFGLAISYLALRFRKER